MEWNERKSVMRAAAFVAMMALALVVGYFRHHALPTADFSAPVTPQERTTRLYEAARAPTTWPKGLPRACRIAWDAMRGLDLAEFIEYPPRPGLIPDVKKCAPPNAELDRAQSEYLRACQPLAQWKTKRTQKEWRRESRPCTAALIGYRAGITRWLEHGRALASIGDPLVLTDLLIASLSEEAGDGVTVAERLLQVEPQMYPAAKAALVGLLTDAATRAAGKPEDPIWEKVDGALRRAEAMPGAEQRQLLETELALPWMRYRDPQRAKEKAQALMLAHPELGAGPYYLAWAEYSAGEREKAEQDLAEAIRREPNERQFRATWDKLGIPGEHPFRTYLSFGFDPK